jgi:hypothetical protein
LLGLLPCGRLDRINRIFQNFVWGELVIWVLAALTGLMGFFMEWGRLAPDWIMC